MGAEGLDIAPFPEHALVYTILLWWGSCQPCFSKRFSCLGLTVSVCGSYRQVGLFSLLGGLWSAKNGCSQIAPHKQDMETSPVWPEGLWLPVHSSVRSEWSEGIVSAWRSRKSSKWPWRGQRPRPLQALYEGIEEIFWNIVPSPRLPFPSVLRIPGHALYSILKQKMPTEPCCSPVVWRFRWGRGHRDLPSPWAHYFLCSSELLWNTCSFQEQRERFWLCFAPRQQ